jgi:hypothetical protein
VLLGTVEACPQLFVLSLEAFNAGLERSGVFTTSVGKPRIRRVSLKLLLEASILLLGLKQLVGILPSLILHLFIVFSVANGYFKQVLNVFYIPEVKFQAAKFLPSSCWFFPFVVILDSSVLFLVGAGHGLMRASGRLRDRRL